MADSAFETSALSAVRRLRACEGYPGVILLVVLCALWVLSGLVGHDPWKPDEAYTFGIVRDFLRSDDWVVPRLAQEPFLEKPPLFIIVAGGFAQLFGHVLPQHDAARLATGFFTALALAFLAATGRELNGRGFGALPALVLIGCIGPVARLHQMVPDVGLVAGVSIGLYGLALARRAAVGGGIALGLGTAVAFMSKGLLGPGWLALTALLLPGFHSWRSRRYARALLIAAAIACVPIAVWTMLLFLRSRTFFDLWLIDNNLGRFLGFVRIGTHNPPFFYAEVLPWFTFPAFPLALWTLWSRWHDDRRQLAEPAIALPLVASGVILAVLGVASDSRNLYLMPIVVPLSLLAAAGVDRLPAWGSQSLVVLSRSVLSAVAVLLWLAWIVLIFGIPVSWQAWLLSFSPGYVPHFRWLPFLVALMATLFSASILARPATSGRDGVTAWAAAAMLCWVLVASLFAPFLNAGKSYRSMLTSLAANLPTRGCVASLHLGEPQRAMLEYFDGVVTRRFESDPTALTACNALLVQGWRTSGANAPDAQWIPVWEGARPGDESELYRLYRRDLESAALVRFPK